MGTIRSAAIISAIIHFFIEGTSLPCCVFSIASSGGDILSNSLREDENLVTELPRPMPPPSLSLSFSPFWDTMVSQVYVPGPSNIPAGRCPMKKFPPRRRLWPAAALLCLLALSLLLPRLSGGRSAPAAPAQTAEEADFFVHLTLSSTPPPCLNSPEVLTQVREILGSMVPLLPRSPGAARAGVQSHRLAGGGAAGHLHHPRPLRGGGRPPGLLPGGGRRPLLLAAARRPSPGPGRPSGRAAGL